MSGTELCMGSFCRHRLGEEVLGDIGNGCKQRLTMLCGCVSQRLSCLTVFTALQQAARFEFRNVLQSQPLDLQLYFNGSSDSRVRHICSFKSQ